MSFNPNTGNLYVCGFNQPQLFAGGKSAAYEAGQSYEGSTFAPQGAPTGTFTAIDAATNRIVWQKHFSDSCYSGSTTTAGNIVFVGRNKGQLQAYNATHHELACRFQNGVSAHNPASAPRP